MHPESIRSGRRKNNLKTILANPAVRSARGVDRSDSATLYTPRELPVERFTILVPDDRGWASEPSFTVVKHEVGASEEVYGLGKSYQVRASHCSRGGLPPIILVDCRENSINLSEGGELAGTRPVLSVVDAGE